MLFSALGFTKKELVDIIHQYNPKLTKTKLNRTSRDGLEFYFDNMYLDIQESNQPQDFVDFFENL